MFVDEARGLYYKTFYGAVKTAKMAQLKFCGNCLFKIDYYKTFESYRKKCKMHYLAVFGQKIQ
jgi:hypothetical protein